MAQLPFSREQLASYSSFGVFQPSTFNDDIRQDLTGEPFLAVDENPYETDDAFRVNRSFGGAALVEVAIADAVQLADSPDIVATALEKRSSVYAERYEDVDPMLPPPVIRQVELSAEAKSRALVVSQQFNKLMRPIGEVAVTPAWVDIDTLSPSVFTRQFAGRAPGTNERLVAKFARQWAVERNVDFARLMRHDRAHDYGAHVVQAYMVLANMALAKWAGRQGVPVLYRAYDPRMVVWNEERQMCEAYGRYTPTPAPHYWLRRMGSPPYLHGTSMARRGSDLLNGLNIGDSLAGREPRFGWDVLPDYAEHLSPQYRAEAA